MKLKPINETRRAVLECIRMRLHEKEALKYLEDAGYPLQHSQYHKHKSWLNKHKLERLHFIAAMGFEDQHLERIDTCELIHKLMWQEWKACEDPYKRVMILKEIKELQPYISSYYEATKDVTSSDNGRRQESISLSTDREIRRQVLSSADDWS